MNTKVLLIVIGVVTALVSAVCIGIYIWKYVRKQPDENDELSENDELTDEQTGGDVNVVNYSAIEIDNIQSQINQNIKNNKIMNEEQIKGGTNEQFTTEHVESVEINEQSFNQPNYDSFNKPFNTGQTFNEDFNKSFNDEQSYDDNFNKPVFIIINEEPAYEPVSKVNKVEVISERSLNETVDEEQPVDEKEPVIVVEEQPKHHVRKRKQKVAEPVIVADEQKLNGGNDEELVNEPKNEEVINESKTNEQIIDDIENEHEDVIVADEEIVIDVKNEEPNDEPKITGGDTEFKPIEISEEQVDIDIPQMDQTLEDIQEQNERYERLTGGSKSEQNEEPVEEQPKIIIVDNDESNSEKEMIDAEDLTLEDFV